MLKSLGYDPLREIASEAPFCDCAGPPGVVLRSFQGRFTVAECFFNRLLGADDVARQTCGLRAVPDSRRLGAYLQRMNQAALEGLRECMRLVSRRLVPLVAQACVQRWGSVPVRGDGPGIAVEGQLCEHAVRGYHGEKQSLLPSVCVVSARLQAGGTDMQGDGREQLDRDAAPWLAAQQPVGLRAASAYSCGALVSSCRQWGGDDSGSVTDPRQKAPILRRVAAREWWEDEGEPLDTADQERATAVAY